jgi:hypothetical protein
LQVAEIGGAEEEKVKGRCRWGKEALAWPGNASAHAPTDPNGLPMSCVAVPARTQGSDQPVHMSGGLQTFSHVFYGLTRPAQLGST